MSSLLPTGQQQQRGAANASINEPTTATTTTTTTTTTIEDTTMQDVSNAAVGGPLQQPSFVYQAPLTNAAEVRTEAKRVIANFLRSHKVYELLPRSGKVVVFGVDIPVKLAFYALTEHGIPVAPIWDEETNSFVGVFTLTDFVEIIRYFYRHGSFTESLTAYSIHAWRSVQKELRKGTGAPEGMISIGPEDTLFEACCNLRDHRIHYLPILDSAENRVLATVAHLAILQYLVREFKEPRRLFDQSIYELGIGVFDNVITVPQQTELIEVLNLLSQHNISSVPVIDPTNGTVLDIYSRNMVVMLGKDSTADSLLRTVGETVSAARQSREFSGTLSGLHTCSRTSSLHDVIMIFTSAKVYRLVSVDERTGQCTGIITLRDLLNYFLLP
jgi:CBS domain-containing protein